MSTFYRHSPFTIFHSQLTLILTLNFKSFGQGFPIIILHGLFGMLDNWQTIAKKLATKHTVYIVDQRNHGRSPHLPEFNYQVLADDLQAFMESNWIYEAHIIGHSMGGKTAMQLALSYPEMVKKLVVVDIAPKKYQAGHQAIFEALQSLDLATISNRKEAATHLAATIPDAGTQQFLLKNLSRNTNGQYEWKMNLPIIAKYYERILDTVQIEEPFQHPTLFIKGGQSNYIQEEDTSAIESFFPLAKIETIPSAGHWVHAAAPKELLDLINTFLAS